MSWARSKTNNSEGNNEQTVQAPLPATVRSPRAEQTIVPMRFGPPVPVPIASDSKGHSSSSKRHVKHNEDRTTASNHDDKTLTSPKNNALWFSSTVPEGLIVYKKAAASDNRSPTLTLSTLPEDQYPDDTTVATAGTSVLSSPMTEKTILHTDRQPTQIVQDPLSSIKALPQPPQRENLGSQRSDSPSAVKYSTPEGTRSPEQVYSEIGTIMEAQTVIGPSLGTTPEPSASVTPFEDATELSFYERNETIRPMGSTTVHHVTFQDSTLSSDSSYARQRRSLLDILNRLHSTGVQNDIDLPQIVVIGSQSVGKSSLIESMSGVTLPRDTGTCTRCPLECRLEYSASAWSCRVFLRFERDMQGNALDKVQEWEFGPVLTDRSEVAAILRRAQRAILRPTLDHTLFLQDKDLAIKEPPSLSFSSNCVCMHITGPDVPDLYFFDLPGVIANVRDGGDIKDIELVRNLVRTYISRPSCLILLVVSCETDFENQGAGRLALEVDPGGHRIVGVLTKPDRIESATGEKWVTVLRNEENRLTNGWFCVKQPDPTELKRNITWEEARLREELFFTHQEPWKSLAERHRLRLGSINLIRFLSRLLSKLISVRLPEVEKELTISLDNINWRLNGLPPPKFEDPSSELFNLIFEFSAAVSREVRGKARLEGTMANLMQSIRIAQIKLRSSIMRTAPKFCPWTRQDTPPGSPHSTITMSSVGTPLAWVSEPVFLPKEEMVPFDDRTGKIMYLDEVMEFAEQSITRELPGDFPSFAVKEELIRSCLNGWGKPMLEYLETVHNLMSQHMKTLVDIHFGMHMHSGLHARVMSVVREQLRTFHEKTLQRLDTLLSVEGLPFTLNHTYLKEYKNKFLDHYKDIRRRSRGQDTIVRRFEESGEIISTQVRNDMDDLTTMLQRFGFPCTPKDLHRLLPDDEFEPALDVIATVRAYFHVASRRFIDQVPLEVDAGFVRSFDKAIRNALIVGLEVKSPERCALWLLDSPEIIGRRRELMATKQRLEAARTELASFILA